MKTLETSLFNTPCFCFVRCIETSSNGPGHPSDGTFIFYGHRTGSPMLSLVRNNTLGWFMVNIHCGGEARLRTRRAVFLALPFLRPLLAASTSTSTSWTHAAPRPPKACLQTIIAKIVNSTSTLHAGNLLINMFLTHATFTVKRSTYSCSHASSDRSHRPNCTRTDCQMPSSVAIPTSLWNTPTELSLYWTCWMSQPLCSIW